MQDLVTVVIPVYNEKDAISKVVNDTKAVMDSSGYKYEIIAVDDCSTDGTGEILAGLGVKVIRHNRTMGSGASRKTGIVAAAGEIIVMTDADGSYDVSDIPRLLEHFPAYDQVIGARRKEMGTMPLLRGPVKWTIRKLAEYLSGTKIPDLNSGLRAAKKSVAEKFLWIMPDGFSCVTTMTLSFLCNGYEVKWVETDYFKRVGKSKFHPLKDTFNYISTVMRIIMYFNPLRFFFPLGSLVFLAGAARAIFNRYFTARAALRPAEIILILAALLIILLGLIADLVVTQSKALLSKYRAKV